MTPNNRCFPRSPSFFFTIVMAVASNLHGFHVVVNCKYLQIRTRRSPLQRQIIKYYMEKDVAKELEANIRKTKYIQKPRLCFKRSVSFISSDNASFIGS